MLNGSFRCLSEVSDDLEVSDDYWWFVHHTEAADDGETSCNLVVIGIQCIFVETVLKRSYNTSNKMHIKVIYIYSVKNDLILIRLCLRRVDLTGQKISLATKLYEDECVKTWGR